MKAIKYITSAVMALCVGMFSSCTDGNDWSTDSNYNRVFTPKINSVTGAEGALDVAFTSYGGNSFLVEVNTNPFPEDDINSEIQEGSITGIVTGSPGRITGLNGYTEYYVRMRAMSDAKKASHWIKYADSEGVQKTALTQGNQILKEIPDADRNTTSITIHWEAGHNPTTVTATSGEGESKVVKTYELTAEQLEACTLTCTDLDPSTLYAIRIYEGDNCVGMREAKTLKAPPVSDYTVAIDGNLIDQAKMNEIAAKAKESNIAAGGTGEKYSATIVIPETATVKVQEPTTSVKIPDGMTVYFFGRESSTGDKGTLLFDYQLDVEGNHQEISFENLNIKATDTKASNKYIINQTTDCSVGNLTFTSCYIADVNCAVVRTQGASNSFGTITFDDCIIEHQGYMGQSYGYVINHGSAGGTIDEIDIKNSTFDDCEIGIISCNTKSDKMINKVSISDCTFYNCIGSGRYIVDAGKDAKSVLHNMNISLKNIIIGKLFHASAKGYQTKGELKMDHVYQLSDVKFSGGSFKTPDDDKETMVQFRLSKQFDNAAMFEDPANHNFNLKHWFEENSDGTLYDIYGDPRWKQDVEPDDNTEE